MKLRPVGACIACALFVAACTGTDATTATDTTSTAPEPTSVAATANSAVDSSTADSATADSEATAPEATATAAQTSAAASPTATAQPTRSEPAEPRRIDVPSEISGLEGIAVRQTDGRVYIGDLNEGSVWSGTNEPDSFTVFATSPRRASAIGLAVDAAADLLYVATGSEGRLDVHNASTGELVAEIELDSAGAGLINDVAVAPDGVVYVTDSGRGRLHQYDPATGEVVVLVDAALNDDINGVVASLQFNGLVATDEHVLVMHMVSATLYRVDRQTGAVEPVTIEGVASPGRDGLLLCGDRLYSVVISAFNRGVSAVRVITLDAERRTGTFVEDLMSETFASAATLDYREGELLVTNAQFDSPTPDTPFWLTALPGDC